MASTDEMLELALRYRPHNVSLVPERDDEITTEGGLDVATDPARLRDTIRTLQEADIDVAIFISFHSEMISTPEINGSPTPDRSTTSSWWPART